MIAAADYAELLEEESLSPLERALYESELRRATNREKRYASMDAAVRESTLIHKWQQDTLRVAGALLLLQFEVGAWERRKHRPFCYDGAYRRMRSKGQGFMKRLARLRREAAEGNAQQQKWMEDHAELLVAVSRCGLPTC